MSRATALDVDAPTFHECTGDITCPHVGFGSAEVLIEDIRVNHMFQQVAKYVLGKSEA
jgi:hypothetical protein